MTNRTENIPTWIEPKLFENVLNESFGEYEKILNFKALHALAPGENYATIMVKIEVDVMLKNGQIQKESFMLKVAHDSELYGKEMTKWDMFNTEADMYQQIVPDFEEMYSNKGLKVRFGAKAYKLDIKEDYVLLEDLTRKGFKNSPRQECLDMIHCRAVLKKMAQWHAASAKRIENKGPYEYKYAKGMFIESGRSLFNSMLENSLKHLIKSAKKLQNNEEYLSQIENLKGNIVDLFYEQCCVDEQEFNVLNHGDCWSNNIMFKYTEDGQLEETYFVDLQITSYGSPSQDLLYFIISSAQLEIKISKFDYLIKFYHDNLIEHLKLLEYEKPLPKLKDLQMSLIRHSAWGMYWVVCVVNVYIYFKY